jgi:antitoxin component YwqK of YwqJK toxin-antitoxin module
MKRIFPIIIVLILSCKQERIKIIADKYKDGTPSEIRYFNTVKDSKENFEIVVDSNGHGKSTKPLSFFEEAYYHDGVMQCAGNYDKGLENGLWKFYYNTGVLQARCYYENGIEIDSTHCYYPSGKIKRILIEINKSRKYWIDTDYYENGIKSLLSHQIKDSPGVWTVDGEYLIWHSNGKLKFQAEYRMGQSVGKWKVYDTSGILIKESDSIRHLKLYNAND